MKDILKKIGTNTILCIGSILVILGVLGILTSLTIAAYEYHWLLGSLAGCLSSIIIGLFIMNAVDDKKY